MMTRDGSSGSYRDQLEELVLKFKECQPDMIRRRESEEAREGEGGEVGGGEEEWSVPLSPSSSDKVRELWAKSSWNTTRPELFPEPREEARVIPDVATWLASQDKPIPLPKSPTKTSSTPKVSFNLTDMELERAQERASRIKSIPFKNSSKRNLPLPKINTHTQLNPYDQTNTQKTSPSSSPLTQPKKELLNFSPSPKPSLQDDPEILKMRKRLDTIRTELLLNKVGLIKETLYPCRSKCSRLYRDGTLLTAYRNESVKGVFPDGRVQIWFPNGDWKMLHKNILHYYYNESQAAHLTFPTGMEQFHFANGQIERLHPTPSPPITRPYLKMEIWHPDKTYRRVVARPPSKSSSTANSSPSDPTLEQVEELFPNLTFPHRPHRHRPR